MVRSNATTTAQLQRWIERLATDPDARNQLITRSAARLTELAHRQLRNFPAVARWELTDDIVQGAAMRLHRALASARPRDAREFFYLAAAMIRRELIDLKRRLFGPEGFAVHHASPHPQTRGSQRLRHDPVQNTGDSTFDPGTLARWTELHERVAKLADEQREVFDLVWYQQLTHEQAAKTLGVSQKSIQRRWREARLQLHHLLDDGEV